MPVTNILLSYHRYQDVMLEKILNCKTPIEVIAIIDHKIILTQKKTSDKSIINKFLDSSLYKLHDLKEVNKDAKQLSKLRVAICHFQTVKIHFKIF